MRNIEIFHTFDPMQLHIIHLKERKDRIRLLDKQLLEQNIINYKIWEGVLDKENPKKGIAKAHKRIIKWPVIKTCPQYSLRRMTSNLQQQGLLNILLKTSQLTSTYI